jgi:hypothetical protein
VRKLTNAISRETFGQYRHYGKTIIVTLFADCVSLRLKGTRKEKAYQLPIPRLMDELCRRTLSVRLGFGNVGDGWRAFWRQQWRHRFCICQGPFGDVLLDASFVAVVFWCSSPTES